MLTRGAIGNLINRYKAVLAKCNLINTFGSLAVAAMMVMGGTGVAEGATRLEVAAGAEEAVTSGEFAGLPEKEQGSAIYNLGTLSVSGIVDFKSNTANYSGGALFNGGILYMGTAAAGSDGYTVLDPSTNKITFTGNRVSQAKSTHGGGALRNTGTAYIANTVFGGIPEPGKALLGNRSALTGGAIQNTGTMTIDGCIFEANTASEYTGSSPRGGAIRNDKDSTLTIKGDTLFQKNSSCRVTGTWFKQYKGLGGAVDSVGTLTIMGNDIKKTASGYEGGVLFKDNTAEGGGAIYIGDGSATVENARFEGNGSLGYGGGGAVKVSGNGISSVTFTNVKFIGNTSSDNGGAVYLVGLADKGTATFEDVEFINNEASRGGAIHNNCTMELKGDNSFTGNVTGASVKQQTDASGVFGHSVSTHGTKANDIDNTGTVNIVSGTTTMDGGITGSGSLNVENGATLELQKDATVQGSKVKFASGSKFIVSHETLLTEKGAEKGAKKSAVIGSGGSGELIVEADAILSIVGVKAGQNYVVASGFTEMDIQGWQDIEVNALTLLHATNAGNGTVVLETERLNAEDVFYGVATASALDDMMAQGINNVDAQDMGVRFLSRAVEPVYLSADETISTINEVSRAAVTAGVQNTSLRIADAASNTVLDHMSLAQHDGSKAIHAGGADFWAAPMYGNLYTSGMNVAGNSVRGQFGGLALGADLEAGQFLGGKFRLGAAINGGGGQSETKGGATSTQNDYDFGGLNFYAGWNSGAFNVIASVGYGFGNHEVEMGLPSSMGMGTAKADMDTTVFTADLSAEYQLKTSWVDVLPHAGIRYTALRTDAHDLKVNGSVLNSVASDTQNIVQFPIGVTLSKDFAFADWNVKPMVDVSVIPAAGDKEANTKVNFAGLDAWDSVNTRIMDSTSWAGTIGVQAEKGDFTLGLNYGVQASSNETDQNIQLKLGWKF